MALLSSSARLRHSSLPRPLLSSVPEEEEDLTLVRSLEESLFRSASREWMINSVVTALNEERDLLEADRSINDVARMLVSQGEERLEALLRRSADVAPPWRGADDPRNFARRALVFGRLAAWVTSEEYVRNLEEWGDDTVNVARKLEKGEKEPPFLLKASLASASADESLLGLVAFLLEKYEVPGALRQSLWYADDDRHRPEDDFPIADAAASPEERKANEGSLTAEADSMRVSYRMFKAYLDAAAGRLNVREALRKRAGLSISKKTAARFVADDFASKKFRSPLGAVRRAQILALGGDLWVADAAARSETVGSAFSSDEEFLATDAMQWIVAHSKTLEEPHAVTLALDFFEEMRRTDPKYSCSGRTPKKVSSAIDAYAASTVHFTDDERFLPNPRGLRPMFLEKASLKNKVTVQVPYDDDYNGGHGPYDLGPGTGRLDANTTGVLRVEEILSLKRLIYEGERLDNCLEDRRSSQLKYVLRARQRSSSYWSFTIADGDKVKHMLLLEVWHLRHGNIVRQAEGPRPRMLPSPEAWYYMQHWCKANNVDWNTWDVYSRLDYIYPCEPL